MIELKKFDESDYDCFGGVSTHEKYMPDAWIAWELKYFDEPSQKVFDSCLILDADGLTFQIYLEATDQPSPDATDLTIREDQEFNFIKEWPVTKAIDWLHKYSNDHTFTKEDFKTWKHYET